jgi:hypothetical protein
VRSLRNNVDRSKIFFTLTSVSKVGINPINQYNTPTGVYCYKLNNYIADLISTRHSGETLPFIPEGTQSVFFFKLLDTANIVETADYQKEDMVTDLANLRRYYNDAIEGKELDIESANGKINQKIEFLKKEIKRLQINNVKRNKNSPSDLWIKYNNFYSERPELAAIGGIDKIPDTRNPIRLLSLKSTEILKEYVSKPNEEKSITDALRILKAVRNIAESKMVEWFLSNVRKTKQELLSLPKESNDYVYNKVIPFFDELEKALQAVDKGMTPDAFYNLKGLKDKMGFFIKKIETFVDSLPDDDDRIDYFEGLIDEIKTDYISVKTAKNHSIDQNAFMAKSRDNNAKISRIRTIITKLEEQIEMNNTINSGNGYSSFPDFDTIVSAPESVIDIDNDSSYDFTNKSAKYFFNVWRTSRIIAIILATHTGSMVVNLWTKILVDILKIDVVDDVFGVIHSNEEKQTVVLNKKVIQVIKKIDFKEKSEVSPENIDSFASYEITNVFAIPTSLNELFNRRESSKFKFRTDDLLNNMKSLNIILRDVFNYIMRLNNGGWGKFGNLWITELYHGTYGENKRIPKRFRKEYGDIWDRVMKASMLFNRYIIGIYGIKNRFEGINRDLTKKNPTLRSIANIINRIQGDIESNNLIGVKPINDDFAKTIQRVIKNTESDYDTFDEKTRNTLYRYIVPSLTAIINFYRLSNELKSGWK